MRATANTLPLVELEIVDLFQLNLRLPRQQISPEDAIAPRYQNVVFIARRRPEWRTNRDAVQATHNLLGTLGLHIDGYSPRDLNAINRLQEHDEQARRELALKAFERAPEDGIADALRDFLPFTLYFQPTSEFALFLGDNAKFSDTAALLMLAWLIDAKAVA